eukprot:CAMPEP_0116056678 /NCGR_PEP_ID=MMETSP0322-20121206/4157_1 /TAXON_ID=163516 /ORGANISM="Leptocylindrus danicus var. apora, Strain B651" /LENGTH=658 /DNA_ID=CAMNT_0003540541 /DNA_START=143 /DNA_END=2119 /DNA_ORIENTATION=+
MPIQWDRIQDPSPIPFKVWLSRESNTNTNNAWEPLRTSDCETINHILDPKNPKHRVPVDGGRKMADLQRGMLEDNFMMSRSSNELQRELCGATWFQILPTMTKKGSINEKKMLPHPMSESDCDVVEKLYQKALRGAMTGKLADVLEAELGGSRKAVVVNKNEVLHMVMMPSDKEREGSGNNLLVSLANGITGGVKTVPLQRGYGPYTIEGVEEEEMLDKNAPPSHLIFVIHGIGEAMFSRSEVSLPSLVDEVNRFRTSLHKAQFKKWQQEKSEALVSGQKEPALPRRIEVLPIEWYDQIHSDSKPLMKSLKATTIQSISSLRAIANDVIFDVMMYLTPQFAQETLECVTGQISDIYDKFLKVHKHFLRDGGKCSIIGHSLGSVITWDLLANLKIHKEGTTAYQKRSTGLSLDTICGRSSDVLPDQTNTLLKPSPSWGPTLQSSFGKTIPFEPDFVILAGSPVGMFLTLRGAHESFDQLRVRSKAKSVADSLSDDEGDEAHGEDSNFETNDDEVSPFTLPCKSLYNIFHPSDPVAYRIEPLLLPVDSKIPDPIVLDAGRLGLHIKAAQMTKQVQKKLSFIMNKVTTIAPSNSSNNSKTSGDIDSITFALGGEQGSSSQRVDFWLQTGPLDNEYLSAIKAHSNYFINTDVVEFVARRATS